MKKFIFSLILMLIFLSSCSISDILNTKILMGTDEPSRNDLEISKYNNQPLRENKSIYINDSNNVIFLYTTVLNPKADSENFTFSMMNSLTGGFVPEFNSIIAEGQENSGPLAGFYGFGVNKANSSITLRGNIGNIEMRSYKIRVNDDVEQWHMQKTLNLNKHLQDLSRSKNKFYYYLVSQLNDLVGFRTQFINLYIKDLTNTPFATTFQNYGIYTNVEQPNANWLSTHGLDKKGQVYKANNFNFERNATILKETTDKEYNLDEFQKILEIQQAKNNQKLIKMLDEINDESKDINEVFDHNFNRKNFLTYTALNILVGNFSNTNQNYLLYSPKKALTWYFIPWDNEDILFSPLSPKKNSPPDKLFGVALYDSNLLYRRFFSDENNKKELDAVIKEVKNTLLPKVNSITDNYSKIMSKYLLKDPDIAHLKNSVDLSDDYIKSFKDIMQNNYDKYIENRKLPTSPYINSITQNQNEITVNWSPSKSTNNNTIKYSVEFYYNENMTNIALKLDNISENKITTNKLSTGTYFCRINAIDGVNIQMNSNKYINDFEKTFYGVFKIIVK